MLAFALTLGFAAGASNEGLFFLLGDSLGVGPLLVFLGAFVGLAAFRSGERKLLGFLGKVLCIRDAVVLWLGLSVRELVAIGVDWGISTIASQSILLFSFGDSFTSLLISELGATFVGTPSMTSLLLGITVNIVSLNSYAKSL